MSIMYINVWVFRAPTFVFHKMLSRVRLPSSISKCSTEEKRAIQSQVKFLIFKKAAYYVVQETGLVILLTAIVHYHDTVTKSKNKKNGNFIWKQRDI